MSQEISTRINCEDKAYVFVDEYAEGVWLSVNVPNARLFITMTVEQAKQMIEALNKVVESHNE